VAVMFCFVVLCTCGSCLKPDNTSGTTLYGLSCGDRSALAACLNAFLSASVLHARSASSQAVSAERFAFLVWAPVAGSFGSAIDIHVCFCQVFNGGLWCGWGWWGGWPICCVTQDFGFSQAASVLSTYVTEFVLRMWS
jgi:hypothetical protein